MNRTPPSMCGHLCAKRQRQRGKQIKRGRQRVSFDVTILSSASGLCQKFRPVHYSTQKAYLLPKGEILSVCEDNQSPGSRLSWRCWALRWSCGCVHMCMYSQYSFKHGIHTVCPPAYSCMCSKFSAHVCVQTVSECVWTWVRTLRALICLYGTVRL